MDIHPLEISNKDPLEVRPVADAVVREEFKPCSNIFPHANGEVLNDEVIIIHSFGLVSELEVFKPYTGIRLAGIFGNVGRWSEALWERRSLDMPVKGLWPLTLRARNLVVRLVIVPRGVFHRSPRWFSRDPCCLLLPLPSGHHQCAGPNASC